MAAISSPGIGSGLDINSLVSQLVAAEAAAPTNRLNRQETSYLTQISALGNFRSALADFQSSLSGINQLATFQARSASSSDKDVLTASANKDAAEGAYSINVSNLAAAHSLVTDTSNPFAATTEAVGEGTLTFKFGTTDYDDGTDTYNSFTQNADTATHTIDIDSSNNSLEGIRDAINEADIGVQASIINNGSGYLLTLASTSSGADNSLEITVSDSGDLNDTDTSGLSRLAFNSSATNLEQTVAASDAALTINGIDITSESNTIADAIEGVSLTLKDAGTATVNVSHNKSAVTSAVDNFVSKYNELINTINELTAYNPDTGRAGALNGDFGVRTITTNVQRIISDIVPGLNGGINSLASLGITTQENGNLEVDSSTLQSKLDSNFDDVAAVFTSLGRPTDSLVDYIGDTSNTQSGSYAVNITQLATQGLINGSTTADLADDGAGNFNTAFVVDADNDTFEITVDGIASNSITLTQKSYSTTSELVAEIQSRINSDSELSDAGVGVDVSFDATNDRVVITSNSYGSDSTIEFTDVDTNTAAELGFDTALTGTDGVDVAGSIGGVSATGEGQNLIGAGDADGLEIQITGGSTGYRGIVTYNIGIAGQLENYMDAILDSDGPLSQRVEGLQGSVESIADQRDALALRLEAIETRLYSQFSALDVLINQLQTTSNFLSSQLGSLPTIQAPKPGG